MVVGVLALQGDVREHMRAVEAVGHVSVAVRTQPELRAVDSIIIPGGESTTIVNLLQAFQLTDPLRDVIADGLPVWGTCAGMILLSTEVLDPTPAPLGLMDISVRRNAYGRQLASFEENIEVAALGPPQYHGVFIRAPAVERVGPDVQVIACLPDGGPVAVRQGHMLATSFHPELTDDSRFHRYFCDL